MNTEKQEQPQTTEPQASQVQQPLKDKAEAGRHPFAKLLVKPKVLVIAAVVILVAIAAVAVLLQTSGREEPQPQVFNKSTLERIKNIGEAVGEEYKIDWIYVDASGNPLGTAADASAETASAETSAEMPAA